MVIICDVCEEIIYTEICTYCGYDNTDQFYSAEDNNRELILRIIDKLWYLDDDKLVETLHQIFGLNAEQIRTIIYESEELSEGFEIE